jgi:hypothetical protein
MANAQDAQATAKILTSLDAWIVAQPKIARPIPGVSFNLADCKGIIAGPDVPRELAQQLAQSLAAASGVQLPILDVPVQPAITLRLVRNWKDILPGPGQEKFEFMLNDEYVLTIDATGIILKSLRPFGLHHAIATLAQIASDRTILPGLYIDDWPSMQYRGVQQDVSRGQVPTPETLMRLADVLFLSKQNIMELYIEHVFKYKAFPDVSPPEGYTSEDARKLSAHAAQLGVEVHPLLQGLGHNYNILSKPAYQHLRIGPCEKAPWIMTFDIRKPEAVQMVATIIDELCDAFPSEMFNIDITEIDIDALKAEGMSLDQVTGLVFDYVLKLDEAIKKHGRRLMITQGPLDSQGHLSGMGPKLDSFPKDIIIGSYYCAGGPYQPAWEKDFPRLHDKGIDFFAQAWIYSHLWLTPCVTRAAEFSNLEVARGLKHGAAGSITCDWGDAGHFHFVGEEWLPYTYHGACAWTGAQLDRDYFRRAYARVLYGLPNDAAIRAIESASDISAKPIRVRDKDGKETDISTTFIWEFVHDPFTHPDITRIVDPAAVGQQILDAAAPAVATLAAEIPNAKRNKDNLEQCLFGVRCYAALGRKLIALGHYNTPSAPKQQTADELDATANEFQTLQTDFKQLWLAEDRNNDGFQELLKRFTYTIVPCREKAKALREG